MGWPITALGKKKEKKRENQGSNPGLLCGASLPQPSRYSCIGAIISYPPLITEPWSDIRN